jgi:hypothetical protein
MPNSPSPTEYKRTLQRFFYKGISLQPQDALAEGKLAWARNIRSYMDGTIEVRYGLDELTAASIGTGRVHTIARLNDPSAAGVADPVQRFIGTGTALFAGVPPSGPYASVDAGPYSGDPLTWIAAQPINSPRPFLYIADADRLRKVNTTLTDYPIGIAQPIVPPDAALDEPQYTLLDPIDGDPSPWTAYGGFTVPAAPAAIPIVSRIATTITTILYDVGSTGFASVVLDDFQNLTYGANLSVGTVSPPETVIVHQILAAVSPTTIAAILYDAGASGLCTIQPAGGFFAGLIEALTPFDLDERTRPGAVDAEAPRVTLTRTVDFPVNALVILDNGVDPAETVRILSAAIGPNGVQSFRCSTSATYAATNTIVGVPSFRAWFGQTHIATDPVDELAYQVVVTPPDTTTPVLGGIQGSITGGARDWGAVGSQALQPEDIIRFGVLVSLIGFVQAIRLVLDVQPSSPSVPEQFLQDYYFFEWREADLIDAIQATSEVAVGLLADAQSDAVTRGETAARYQDQFGYSRSGSGVTRGSRANPRRGIQREAIDPGPRVEGRVAPRTGRRAVPRDGAPQVGGGVSRQLALGNNVWLTLECRVGDLIRVGGDQTLTLGAIDAAAIWAQILGTDSAVTLEFSDVYVIGGYGPEVSQTLPPYVYRYSYRSTITGARSNPSPPMRAGVTPRRQRVNLEATPSTDTQVDIVDWWRFGGALARWAHVGTSLNDPAVSPAVNPFDDDRADKAIDGGERIRSDLFQPWPTTDLPRSGTCDVAGTAVERVSGDLFDTAWSADTLIVVNGIPTQLYRSPSSTSRLEVVDNVGSGTGVPFTLPSPTLLAQPMPVLFGGPINNIWFHFGCGDPNNPGTLHWTHGNDPDASSDVNTVIVTSASEPLMNGWIDDGIPYVFSSKRLYRILPIFSALATFQVVETNCSRGLWTRWGFAPHPEGGAFFIRKDGIWFTRGGSDAILVTQPDLSVLFGQDGTDAEAIRNLTPVDFTDTNRLRLAIVGRLLYFDYVDTAGEGHTLVMDLRTKAWTPDAYLETGSPLVPTGVTVRESEQGQEVYDHILALENDQLYQYTLAKTTDVLTDINWAIWTPWAHGEDPRAWKQWGDAVLDFNPGTSDAGITVTPVIDNANVALDPQVVGAGGTERETYLIEVGLAAAERGDGVISRNCGLRIEGAVQACDIQRPIFYYWEPSFLWKGLSVARRATDWEDFGYRGAKFVQGVVIRANTFGVNKTVEVQYDGPNDAPQVALTLTLNHDGEQTIAYPRAAGGWTPFIAELVRLQGADDIDWVPELATQWETQYTTFDFPGFLDVHDGIVALQSTAQVDWFIEYQDGDSGTYAIPSSAGAYLRTRVITQAQKGKAVRFRWTSTAPFRLFKRDCAVRVQPWGVPGGYMLMNPFGGPSRDDGAGI